MIYKSSKIVINGEEYRYRVTGYVSVIWQCPDGKKKCWYRECKPKWKQQLGPKDFRRIILGLEKSGSYRDL